MNGLLDWVRSHQDILLRTAHEHMVLSGVALLAAIAVAVPLGMALSRPGRQSGVALGFVNTLRAIPSLALLVVMLPVLGTGFAPSCVALAVYGLPAVLLNTMAGLAGIDRDVLDAARGQGFTPSQILARIELPLASPMIVAGIRSAAVQIVGSATLAVFIGGGGLGELISAGMGLLDIPQLIAGSLAVALLAGVTELALSGVEQVLARRFGTRPA